MVDHYISLERAVKRMYAVTEEFGTQHIFIDRIIDELENIPSCPISTPAVPGPSESDPNIMELCFHNGERHMKEKVGKELSKIAEHMPCITLAQAIAMLEGL